MSEVKRSGSMTWLLPCVFIFFFSLARTHRIEIRTESLERIVGTETPASMTWTNGHTYSTIVKHSANCPCVKK